MCVCLCAGGGGISVENIVQNINDENSADMADISTPASILYVYTHAVSTQAMLHIHVN